MEKNNGMKNWDKRMNGVHIAALVLARGGSKGIPSKNIVKLNGKPLLIRTLETLILFNKFDSIWVSTDDPKIAHCVLTFDENNVKIFDRSPQFAMDESPSIDAVQEFLSSRPEIDVIALVQCTSPFMKVQYLDKAMKYITSGCCDSVFSVCRLRKLRWSEEEYTKPLNFDPQKRPRRQDWKGELVENGMFYFAKRHLLEAGLFQGEKTVYVEVQTKHSIEIDSPLDLMFAEQILINDNY